MFQILLLGNKNSQQNLSIPGKELLLFDEIALKKKTNLKKTEKGKRLEIRENLPPKYGCRRTDSPVLMTQIFPSFVVKVRRRESSFLDSEDCEQPSLIESDEEIRVVTLSTCTVQGRISATGAAKVEPLHKTLQVVPCRAFSYRRLKNFFFVTLNKCSSHLP